MAIAKSFILLPEDDQEEEEEDKDETVAVFRFVDVPPPGALLCASFDVFNNGAVGEDIE